MHYEEAIEYIQSFPDMERGTSSGLSMSLQCMRSLLAEVGNPHKLARTVHITGSKGKGSTGAMIDSILNKACSSSAFYSSPHLNSYTERLSVWGKPVSQKEFAAGVARIKSAADRINASESGPVATFGILTALFFDLVRHNHMQWQVVEVGLGGEHDATNLFDDTEVVVITPVSLEHTNILGATVEEIARQKAGIIKPGCTVVVAPQKEPKARTVITDRARELGCDVIDVSGEYLIDIRELNSAIQHFTVECPYGSGNFSTRLTGLHQIDNAATAIAAAHALQNRGHEISTRDIETGLANAWLPGRLETVCKNPLVIVDGAHNADSAQTLKNSLAKQYAFKPAILVLAMNSDKDPRSIIEPFACSALSVIATRTQNPRSIPPFELAGAISSITLKDVRVESSIPDSLEQALLQAKESDLILVVGSLYAAGEAREFFLSKKTGQKAKKRKAKNVISD